MNNHFVKRGRNQRRRQGGGPNPNRALDSNGPDVRIRGTAQQIYDKYQALARDAQSSGDRVKAENYLQHAEHYFRVLRATQGSAPVSQFDQNQDGDGDGDADQPGAGDGRDQRNERPQQHSFSNEDQGDGDQAGDDQPEIPAYGEDRPQEPRQDQRAQNSNGGQHGGGGNGGDQESRRRRRRPRRPREDGAPVESGDANDEPDPAPAS